MIAAVGNDRGYGVLHPRGHSLCAEVVENENLGLQGRTVSAAVAHARRFVVRAADALQQVLVIEEHPLESPRDQLAEGRNGEVRLTDAVRSQNQQARLLLSGELTNETPDL